MEFKKFCTIVEKWKKQGKKLKIINLNKNETNSVFSYEIIKPTSESGTIISFKIDNSHSHMLCEKTENKINEINEESYEFEVNNRKYRIIVI